jgi:hypothetical protein
MAIATVTNLTSSVLNAPVVGGNQVSPDAVGGNVLNPVPFPFGSNGSYAANGASGDSKDLKVHARDLIVRVQPQETMNPADELNQLINGGVISLSVATDGDEVDAEKAVIADI